MTHANILRNHTTRRRHGEGGITTAKYLASLSLLEETPVQLLRYSILSYDIP